MRQEDQEAFSRLIHDVYKKAFNKPLAHLSTREREELSIEIQERTGLRVTGRTLYSYVLAVLDRDFEKINPSYPKLDLLARYVLEAPRTTEAARAREEDFSWWQRYKMQSRRSTFRLLPGKRKRLLPVVTLSLMLLLALALGFAYWPFSNAFSPFIESFDNMEPQALRDRGWFIANKNTAFWDRGTKKPGNFVLYALPGSVYPWGYSKVKIQNLLLRRVPASACQVILEVESYREWDHPGTELGIILLEDTSAARYPIRLSLVRQYPDSQINERVFETKIAFWGGKVGSIFDWRITKAHLDSKKSVFPIWLKITLGEDKVSFYYKEYFPENWWSFLGEFPRDMLSFAPRFVGIFAFRNEPVLEEGSNKLETPPRVKVHEFRLEPLE